MSELRKPDFVLLLKISGKKKTNRVELFKRELFTDEPLRGRWKAQQYRLRVNGKWFPKDEKQYYPSWQIKEIFWKSLPF